GLLATGTSCLAEVWVIGLSRVTAPPDSTRAFIRLTIVVSRLHGRHVLCSFMTTFGESSGQAPRVPLRPRRTVSPRPARCSSRRPSPAWRARHGRPGPAGRSAGAARSAVAGPSPSRSPTGWHALSPGSAWSRRIIFLLGSAGAPGPRPSGGQTRRPRHGPRGAPVRPSLAGNTARSAGSSRSVHPSGRWSCPGARGADPAEVRAVADRHPAHRVLAHQVYGAVQLVVRAYGHRVVAARPGHGGLLRVGAAGERAHHEVAVGDHAAQPVAVRHQDGPEVAVA